MKNLIITSFLLLLMSVSAFAQDKSSELTNKSFEIFASQIETLQLKGEVAKDEKLKPILDDLGEFIGEHLFSMMSDDEPDYKGAIKNFKAECSQTISPEIAKCVLLIEYKISDLAISFNVMLDQDNQPLKIINNEVYLTRGD